MVYVVIATGDASNYKQQGFFVDLLLLLLNTNMDKCTQCYSHVYVEAVFHTCTNHIWRCSLCLQCQWLTLHLWDMPSCLKVEPSLQTEFIPVILPSRTHIWASDHIISKVFCMSLTHRKVLHELIGSSISVISASGYKSSLAHGYRDHADTKNVWDGA